LVRSIINLKDMSDLAFPVILTLIGGYTFNKLL
jgi:hypothetical protein